MADIAVRRILVLAAAAALALSGVSAAAAAADDPEETGTVEGPGLTVISYVQLQNERSGRCVEPDQRVGKGRAEGGPVLQWTCHGGSQQQWRQR